MMRTEQIDGENPSDNLICPQCNTSLPSHALFCGACGKRISQKSEKGKTLVKIGKEDAQKLASETWGWLPVLSLVSAAGVFLVALAYEGGRIVAQWAEPLFWLGLLVLFLPIAARLLSARPARRERIALLFVLAISLYLVKFLEYPNYFAGYDEFSHWRTARDIVVSGHLFQQNPLLPISAYYPGLEIATTALSNLTGLSLFISGIMLIGVIQLVFVPSLYFFYERCTDSARVAGIAAVLYMANPGYLFFDMDFAYESLALPLAIFVLFALFYRSNAPAGSRKSLTVAIWLGLGAVVVTHHLTSYALVAFLFFWTAVFLILHKVASFHPDRPQKGQRGPGAVALLGLALSITWLVYTGDLAVGYLAPHIDSTVQQILQIIAGESAPRQLFHNASGFVVPLWERLTSYASVALILLGLPFGFFRIWQHHRANAIVLALACLALAYPVSQALRLTHAGGEIGNRATEFVFLGIAFVLAIGVTQFWSSRAPSWRRRAMLLGAVGIICFGQMVLGGGQPWSLLPGPYLVSADSRSIEPEGITAAEWAISYLGPGHRIASDRINTLLMATYGDQRAETSGGGNIPESQVFTSRRFGNGVIAILQQNKVEYLVVDRRLSTELPYIGTYFNSPASGEQQSISPIDPVALAKFDNVQNVSRIFDSGDIIIYDVEAISNAPAYKLPPQSSCPAASPAVAPSSYPRAARLYAGTLYDVATGRTMEISLTDVQQQRGNICGDFNRIPANVPFSGIPAHASFKGTITSDGQIQFVLNGSTGRTTFSFDGAIHPNGLITGAYCSSKAGIGKCSDYGLWSVSPAPSG